MWVRALSALRVRPGKYPERSMDAGRSFWQRETMLPLGFKLAYTAFVAVLLPVYADEHGWVNFLWFSNVALLGGLLAAWTESARLAGMFVIAVVLLELIWLLDFLIGLVLGGNPVFGLVDYMFDPLLPLHVRLLSLYHVPMPFVLLWMTWRLGYDPRAWRYWVPAGWIILLATFFLSNPRDNVNWVYGPVGEGQQVLPAWLWLAILMLACAAIWWLTHRLLLWGMRRFGRVMSAG